MNTNTQDPYFNHDVTLCVARAIAEDIGDGDITALLIPDHKKAEATVLSREHAIICGKPWVNEVFLQLDSNSLIEWHVSEGDEVHPNHKIFTVKGNARALLSAERTALNFLQTLSATATIAKEYSKLTSNNSLKILDTRKTIPGLRLAQKYAVRIGGCQNHRIGLYDAFLIKENHILACGSIKAAVKKARSISSDKPIEIEVENIIELKEALKARADTVLLDNFSLSDMETLQDIDLGDTKIEVSGNLNQSNIAQYSNFAVNYLSSGSLTKNLRAIDLSMRFTKV